MQWNVLELAENGRYVKLKRGFLVVMSAEEELGRVTIDELCCLMLTADQATLSKPVMVRLAEEGIPIVVCGKNYHPIALTLPYSAHHVSTKILRQQIDASAPLKKRLWQVLVARKIEHQALVLEKLDANEVVIKQLAKMSSKVGSGDPQNIEAQAAKVYWRAILGDEFRRNNDGEDFINASLNYGYSIIRAACARAVVAAGLTPSLGVYHKNQGNPFCLVDDLMEVYRPLVDFTVSKLPKNNLVTPDEKRMLAKLLQADIKIDGAMTTVTGSMQKLAFSLVKSYQAKEVGLKLPTLVFS
ncbi:type II CRISPR-associated endonuclease Cas1 [Aurantivibrio plasticivorans]